VINPAISMLLVVGLFVWMLFHPKSTTPAKIFFLIVAVLVFGPISVAVMDAEAAAFPLKLDYHLYRIDEALGISAFVIASFFSRMQRDVLFVVYETLGYWMIVWYALNLSLKDGRPRKLLKSYAIGYGLAPLFYLVVPACGPRHAFGAAFPFGHPAVSVTLTKLAFWPNAIPSLHIATAILLVYFAGSNRYLRLFAWFYLAGTAAATLAFEHYLIDLVVGVPYAYFAIRLAEGDLEAAVRNLVLVLGWLVSIRFATPLLIEYPLVLQLLVFVTISTAPWGHSRNIADSTTTDLPESVEAAEAGS
jgi:hypothetical protein